MGSIITKAMYYIGFKKPNKVGILKKEVLDKHEKQL